MHEKYDSRFIPLNELCLTLTGHKKGNGDKQNWNILVHRRHRAENGPNDVRKIKTCDEDKNLGVTFNKMLPFSPHIHNAVNKQTKVLD